MSKFFNALSSSSESDEILDNLAPNIQKNTQATKFLVSSDDENEDIKRTIKSDYQKKFDLLKNHVSMLDMYITDNNFEKLHKEFEFFSKCIQKSKSSFKNSKIPWFVVQCLVSLESLIDDFWKNSENKSKLNKASLKALAPLRQKIRRMTSEFQDLILQFKTNPELCIDNFMITDDHPIDVDTLTYNNNENIKSDDILSDKSNGSTSDDDSDDSTSSFEIPAIGDNQTPAQIRQFFIKKNLNKTTVKRERKDKEVKKTKKKEVSVEFEPIDSYHETKLFSNEDQVSLQTFLNKVKEILKSRGKKSYYLSYKNDLTYMINLSQKREFGTHILCGLTLEKVMAIFENLSMDSLNLKNFGDEALSYESAGRGRNEKKIELIIDKLKLWIEAVIDLIGLITLCVGDAPKLAFSAECGTPADHLFETSYDLSENGWITLQGDLYTYVNMADEYFVSLLNACDSNVKEYMEILQYESYLATLIDLSSIYYRYYHKKFENNSHISNRLAELYLIKIELTYYKPMVEASKLLALQMEIIDSNNDPDDTPEKDIFDPLSIRRLHREILLLSTQEMTKIKASLYLVYNLAINNQLKNSETLFFSLNIQNKLKKLDIYTQIQYNRAILQLSICYFRNGYFKQCYDIIYMLWNTNKLKELIGQTVGYKSNTDRWRFFKEKRYPIPYHMQINVQLIECILLVSSLLLQSNLLNENFLKSSCEGTCSPLIENVKRLNNHIVPIVPSTVCEFVVTAAKYMKHGDWKNCYLTIIGISIWKCLPDFNQFEPILIREIKKCCLLSYLIVNACRYKTIKSNTLAKMFDFPLEEIKQTITKAIFHNDLKISWDELYVTLSPLVHSSYSFSRDASNILLEKVEKTMHEYDIFKANKNTLLDISSSVQFK